MNTTLTREMSNKVITVIITLALWSCNTGKSIVQHPTEGKGIACHQQGTFPLDWTPVVLKERSGNKLPLKYTAYTIDEKDATKFFEDINAHNGGDICLPLPDSIGCRVFTLSRSGTLNSALAEKYHRSISLKGFNKQERSNIVRLDYDGNKISIEIIWNRQVFFIRSGEYNGKLYYLLYRKEDAGIKRIPYEQSQDTPAHR